jgi:hypothetical protein
MYATFDRTGFPVIIVAFTGEKETPENFQEYLDGLYQNYDRKEPFSLVFDAKDAPTPSPTYQAKQATWMKAHETLIQTHCRGVAYVMPNAFMRNVLKLIFKIQDNPVPFKVFANREEGIDWASQQMGRGGTQPPGLEQKKIFD